MLPQAGTLPTTTGTLYTVPAKFNATLHWLQAVTVSAATVQFFATVRGTVTYLTPPVRMDAGALLNILEGTPLLLDSGALIRGVSTAADTYFLIAGEEKLK